jgi:hypothetical protein
MRGDTTAKLIVFILLVLLFVFVAGCVFMVLWNWIVPYVFHGPEISIWMALGIMMLVGMLLGSLRRK